MTAAYLVRGDARRLPLANGSVQCVVTSPPYFGLRSYGGQTSVWGGDPECPHTLADDPAVKPMTGGTGAASAKQVTNAGSQFGNAFHTERYYVEGGGTAGSSKEAFSTPGPENAARIKAARWRTTSTCTRCGAWRGELGSEPTPALFVAHLVDVMRECWRVLRDDGVAFLNMGDSYAGSGKGPTGHNGIGDQIKRQGFRPGNPDKNHGNSNRDGLGGVPGTRPKSLLLVPERLAIALSDDGWIVRSRIAWCKAAPMPESVDDRPTSAWEHIWQLTKSNKALFWTHRDGPGTRTQPAPDYRWRKEGVELTEEPEDAKEQGWKRVNLWRGHDYYYDVDAVREPHAEKSFTVHTTPRKGEGTESTGEKFNKWLEDTGNGRVLNPAGANQRNWWLLGPDPYPGQHWATYPRELVRRCVAAATSSYGACAACGAPWKRVVEREALDYGMGQADTSGQKAPEVNGNNKVRLRTPTGHTLSKTEPRHTGWAPTCKCGPSAGVRPCVVLDPFSGSGTSCFVAASMGRIGVGVELSAEYIAQARYGRLRQDFLPLAPKAPLNPTSPTRAAERQVGLFESEVGG